MPAGRITRRTETGTENRKKNKFAKPEQTERSVRFFIERSVFSKMKKGIRIIAVFAALCLLLGSVSLAEECGIGEAAAYTPVTVTQPQAASPATTLSGAGEASEAKSGTAVSADSDEGGTRGFVTRMYRVVLGREPDAAGLEMWVSQLESGRFGAADIVTRFFNSPEYKGKNKSSAEVVTDCYNAMLGRNPDESGFEHWQKYLDIGMTADRVCYGFLDSTEFRGLAASYGIRPGMIVLSKARDQNYERTAFVYRLYQDCLNRTPDIDGLEHWCNELWHGSAGTFVAKGFVFSSEYKNRLPSNETYLEMLYHTILGRDPDEGGKSFWLNLLNYSFTRERVLNKFMFSQEFSGKCSKAGINVGQAIYEPDNSPEWAANILVLSIVNDERTKAGLQPVTTREDLWERVAMVRAREVKQYFSHTRPDGSDWFSAYTDAGFADAPAAENIAYGYKTAAAVMKAWMNSYGHRANILASGLTTLATGCFSRTNWSQNFYVESK